MTSKRKNPVAKFAGKFNQSRVYKDRKKALKRGELKHKSKQWKSDSIAA